MLQLRRRLFGLCLVPILLAALDGSVTLQGQPKEYWAGDHSHVIEGTPFFRILLTHGPAAYVAGLAGWVLAFVGMILLAPETLALTVTFIFTLGHAVGAYSWLVDSRYFFQLYYAMLLFAAVGLAVGIRWGWRAEPQNDAPVGTRLHWILRWLIIVADYRGTLRD
jgi:hypothetical protein